MKPVTKEVADQEVIAWLDFKKISESKRETYRANMETLSEAIQDGVLTLDENKAFVHKLKFQIGEEKVIDTLTYTPRIIVSKVHAAMKGVESGNGDGRIVAYISALTGQAKGVIGKMDTEDFNVAQAIILFFL